jgi:hypothetical protein
VYEREHYERAIDLFAKDTLPVEKMITSTLPLEDPKQPFTTSESEPVAMKNFHRLRRWYSGLAAYIDIRRNSFTGAKDDKPNSWRRHAWHWRIQCCTLLHASEEDEAVVVADLLDGTGGRMLADITDDRRRYDYPASSHRFD